MVNAVLMIAAVTTVLVRSGDDPEATGSPAPPGVLDAGGPGGPAPSAEAGPASEVAVPGGTSGLPGRRSAGPGEVANRPWPARVAAPGPWSSTLAGRGDLVELTVPGTLTGALGEVTFGLGAADPRQPPGNEGGGRVDRYLLLPDGARWYPLGRTRLEGMQAVGFAAAAGRGRAVSAVAPLETLLAPAGAGVTGVGTFVKAGGEQVERLALPPGTRALAACRATTTLAPCQPESPALGVEVVASGDLAVRSAGDGEVAVAGSVRASALGRTWEGLVGAIEAGRLRATATFSSDRDLWTVAAEGAAARQVWIDVWPVVDTRLEASSGPRRPTFLDGYAVSIRWKNVGFATSQIFEAEGVGPGAAAVGFDLNRTVGHDAGVGVTRGDRVVNLRGGGDIDSNLAPGEGVERGLSATRGTTASIVLRGNFPDVTVPLAIPRP